MVNLISDKDYLAFIQAERERRRKEETKRIRTLIEIAYAKDPRLAKFKKEDQLAKEQAKVRGSMD